MMVKCPFCHATHVANTVFCGECGNYLLKDEDRQTDPLDDVQNGVAGIEYLDASTGRSGIISFLQVDPIPQPLKLRIGDQKREIEIVLDKTLLLGRVDPTSNVFPEIDLSDYGSMGKSISRRHAQISKRDGQVTIEDLASVNGTFINGKRLSPYMPEVINDGDTLHLGKLPIQIKIQQEQTP
jgi:hypothetical protein